jgi:resuscitation-promoting factor RpfB
MPPAKKTVLRRSLALALVAALALPAIVLSKRVELLVDGDPTRVRTYAATVGDLLDQQGVVLAAGDRVLPAPHEPLADGGSIRILRTISVELWLDGEPVRSVRGTFSSVGGALAAAGITDTTDLEVSPGLRTSVADGDSIRVRRPWGVTVVADGETRTVETVLRDPALLLVDLGVDVGADDIVTPPVGIPLVDGVTITVQRVASDEFVEEIALPFTTERRGTDDLFVGQSRTVQKGQDGLQVDTYRITLVDGVETERELVSSEIVREPVNRIIEEGTRKRPPPPSADDIGVWYDLARCESGLRWHLDSTYDGGLQFHPSTWNRWKPSGYPDFAWQATPEQQITVGKRLQAARGWGAWPSCARKLGLL